MLEVCASKIGDIILSVLESKMENKLDEVKKAKIISDTRKSICEFEEKYLQNHDGTVLTSREFGEYLQYSKPIEEIFSTIWDTSTEIAGTTEIVEKLSTQCIESIKEKGRTIPPTENHLIKHFFEASVEIVSKMAREAITPGERMTQMQIKDLRNDMDGKLADIQAQLNQRERLSPEEEESIFDALYTILCGGEVHQIQKLVPLFQKKSDSIELALSVLIQLMAGEGNSPEVIVESIQKIENCYVRNIVIRFIIAYGFLWKEVVGEISSSSVDLKFKKIAGDLYTENWDKIFELKRDEKEYRVVLLVKKEYREEIWLGKRILFWYLNRFRDKCVIGLDDDLFTQPITIYDEMLLAWGKTHLYGGEDKEGKTKKEIENLLRRKSIVENLGIQSQLLYWEILFEICMENGDKETVVHYLPQIPDQIKESKTIKEAKFFVQILDENVNEQELVRFCISIDDASALEFYCAGKDAEFVIKFYEKYGVLFENNYGLFEEYVLACKRKNRCTDDLIRMVEEQKDRYKNRIEYWNLYSTLGEKVDFVDLCKQVKEGKVVGKIRGGIEFAHKLLNNKYILEARQICEMMAATAQYSNEYKVLLGRLLIAENKYIEALDILKAVEEDGCIKPFVIEKILQLSIVCKRRIDRQTIINVQNVDTAYAWAFLAQYYIDINKKDEAMKAITKALLRATENDGTIYGQYFSMHAQLCGEREEKCNGLIQENTSAVLCEEETGNKYVVCVYAEALIPNRNGLKQPYTWENVFHMTVSDAVEKNLYLQKKGDKITIGKKTYVVESVVPVDYFLLQKAMNKSLEQGIAYKIEIPTLENGRTNIDAFFDEIKKYTPEKNDLLEEYRKMDKVPLPLYALRQSVTIPYGQFVHIAFRDSMIVIRSDSHLSITATKNTRYVLSFSAAIFFMQAGITAEDLIQNNVYIPESLHESLDMEWSKTLQDKSREKIATMMFDQGQPIIHEESDKEKRYFIQEAGKRKSESEKLKFIKNNKSINITGRDDIQLQDLFGICDYDALSIAVHQNFTLVAFEPLLIAMSQKELLDFQCTGIVDFLCVTDFPLDKTLKVICFMAKCKFEKILSDEIISVLIQKFDEVESDEEREKCMTLWFEFFDVLDKKEDESEYKGLFVQNVLIALQAYLRKGGSEQEIRNLTRKPMIKVAICLLYNSKCIDLQYDEKRVLPTTEQEMGKNG